jgi:hypothetical protein
MRCTNITYGREIIDDMRVIGKENIKGNVTPNRIANVAGRIVGNVAIFDKETVASTRQGNVSST